ncbi:MAG: PAS domain-containing sensor histidine kinase [Chitinophagaceae bacterium]
MGIESTSGVFNDIEWKQAMLASIVESSEDAIISKTLESIITSWNQSAERLFGYTEEEVLGKHISILLPADRLNEEEVIIKSIIAGDRIDHFQTVRRKKDGSLVDISLTVSPVRNNAGEIIGASKIARDISIQVAMEARLTQANIELQKSNLYKDEFIGLLGHELRTPLTSVKACIQLMREWPERIGELTNKADKQVNRMTNLLVELVDFAKSQAGRLEINTVPTSATEFINNAIETVQQSHPEHAIRYESEHQDLLLNVDALRMEQVVINLLTNAIKYSPGATEVIVRSAREGEVFHVSVQDFGMGIPQAEVENIWNRFYRVKGHRANFKGLGLGLHLCRQLISLHKGRIWVESTEGTGSVFHFTLPIN